MYSVSYALYWQERLIDCIASISSSSRALTIGGPLDRQGDAGRHCWFEC